MKQLLTGFGVLAMLGLVAIGCDNGGSNTTNPVPHQSDELKEARSFFGTDCITFEGLQHCPLGSASIETVANPDGSSVLRTSSSGATATSDGVEITLPTAISWGTSMKSSHSASGNEVHIEAVSDGSIASSVDMAQSSAGGYWNVGIVFTNMPDGSSYTVNVYNGDLLEGSQTGVSALARTRIPRIPNRPRFPRYYALVASGCTWDLGYDEVVSFTLPDGTTVSGDRVEFVEEVDPAGSYQYREFESMRIRSNIQSFDLWNETYGTAD